MLLPLKLFLIYHSTDNYITIIIVYPLVAGIFSTSRKYLQAKELQRRKTLLKTSIEMFLAAVSILFSNTTNKNLSMKYNLRFTNAKMISKMISDRK